MLKKSTFLLLASMALNAKEVSVDLNDPIYRGSTISTDKGGVIQSENLRIQADNIEFTEIDGVQTLKAFNNLLVIYGDNFLVGDEFTYNFDTNMGELKNGTSMLSNLFVRGEKIHFLSDGSIQAMNSHITSEAVKDPFWKVSAKDIKIDEKTKVKGSDVTLNVYDKPVFWLPSMSRTINEKFKTIPTFGYQFNWENNSGPLLTLSYKVLDEKNLKVFTRLETRANASIFGDDYFTFDPHASPRSIGGSIGVDWKADDKKQSVVTRNFYAFDLKPKPDSDLIYGHRYRIQGQFKSESADNIAESFCQWDVVSDKDVATHLPSHDLDIKTSYRNEAFLKLRYDNAFLSAFAKPRLNSFSGVKQELPTLIAALKPYEIPGTGIILQNTFQSSYIDYTYAPSLKGQVPDFHSGRFQTEQTITRPFLLGALSVIPKMGINGIFYTNSPSDAVQRQLVFHSDLDAKLSYEADFANFSHLVEPFVEMKYRSTPSVSTDNLYVFDLKDGLNSLNQIKFGVSNAFFPLNSNIGTLDFDIYGYTISSLPLSLGGIPKAGAEISYNLPRLSIKSTLGWNVLANQYDFANLFAGWTISDSIALSAELRSRGSYDWRKCDHENFMIDLSRSMSELATSTMSDPRTSFLARMQFELAPLWTVQLQSQLGVRPGNVYYADYGINISTVFSNIWLVKFSIGQKHFNPAPADESRKLDYNFAISLL